MRFFRQSIAGTLGRLRAAASFGKNVITSSAPRTFSRNIPHRAGLLWDYGYRFFDNFLCMGWLRQKYRLAFLLTCRNLAFYADLLIGSCFTFSSPKYGSPLYSTPPSDFTLLFNVPVCSDRIRQATHKHCQVYRFLHFSLLLALSNAALGPCSWFCVHVLYLLTPLIFVFNDFPSHC